VQKLGLTRDEIVKHARSKGWQRVSASTYDSFAKGGTRVTVVYREDGELAAAKVSGLRVGRDMAPTKLVEWLAHPVGEL